MRCHDQNIDEAVTDYDSVEAVPLLAPDDDGGPKVDEGGDGQERGAGPGIGRGRGSLTTSVPLASRVRLPRRRSIPECGGTVGLHTEREES